MGMKLCQGNSEENRSMIVVWILFTGFIWHVYISTCNCPSLALATVNILLHSVVLGQTLSSMNSHNTIK